MPPELKKYEAIIVTLVNRWLPKVPRNSIYNRDDLVSEAWVIYHKIKHIDIKVKRTTYFYKSVETKFLRICLEESKNKHLTRLQFIEIGNSIHEDDSPALYCADIDKKNLSPERLTMLAQAIAAITEVSVDFALMITNGAPKELVAMAKRNMRSKRFRNGMKAKGGTFTITAGMIENYFGVNIKKVSRIVSNYY